MSAGAQKPVAIVYIWRKFTSMQEASFSGTIKIIFYIVLFYYIFKFAMRLLLPVLMRKAMDKAQENMRRRFERDEFDAGGMKKPSQDRAKTSRQVGEYVDYEELP